MSTSRYHDFEDTMAVDTARIYHLHRTTRLEPGAIVTDDEAEAMHEAASARTEVDAEPRGKHRAGPLDALFLRLRRRLFG